jgi:SAM-dependent methyltransferase
MPQANIPQASIPQVFDRTAVRRQRDRAAPGLEAYDFLLREVADRLGDCLLDIKRTFPLALDIGCHSGQLSSVLAGRGGIEQMVQCDLSPAMVTNASGLRLAVDEEAIPFADGTFDLIISNLSMHWVNDLPGAFSQIRRALKPDGLFLCAMLGGGTLDELRQSLMAGEMAVKGGASPRVSPFVDPHDAGALMQRAGFALPVIDTDQIVLSYSNPFSMMAELRGLGEGNAVAERQRTFTSRAIFENATHHYLENYGDDDGRIPATFQIITLTGWAPHESQQQPLARGSGQTPLGDVLG